MWPSHSWPRFLFGATSIVKAVARWRARMWLVMPRKPCVQRRVSYNARVYTLSSLRESLEQDLQHGSDSGSNCAVSSFESLH